MRVRKMKVLKGISLFFVYPAVMFVLGLWCGVQLEHFFYPGDLALNQQRVLETPAIEFEADIDEPKEEVAEVASNRQTLCADTVYVLEEVDVLRGTSVETRRNLPAQFLGLDREQFMQAMSDYELAPPLSEQERGFESLEVLSFSRERVMVRMNYRYVQPGQDFYLAVKDHEVVVYLEDKKTLYISTGIMLETLPEQVQLELIQMQKVEGEANLYNFLEAYSS